VAEMEEKRMHSSADEQEVRTDGEAERINCGTLVAACKKWSTDPLGRGAMRR
jgi:hypothetical protein